jgi:hypothetical protein
MNSAAGEQPELVPDGSSNERRITLDHLPRRRTTVTAGLDGMGESSLVLRAEAQASLSSEATLLLDGRLRILAASSNTLRLLGRGPAELRGRPLSSCAPEDDAAAQESALASLLGCEGARGQWDLRLRVAAGPPRTFECRAVNLLADATVGGVVVNLRDIHDQRVAEMALRAAHDQLARQFRALSVDRAVDAALSRIADLLQHCTTDREAHDVVWGSLSTVLPGLSPALFFESEDHLEFVRHRDHDEAQPFLPVDACWALRTRRSHVSWAQGILRCDHVPVGVDAACLPLVAGGHAFGLVVVTSRSADVVLPSTTELDRLGARLSVAIGNARARRGPETS